jgi:hypothetical protein
MTPAEIGRAIDSKNRLIKIEAKEKASYDYIQATLIIKGISICLGDKSSFPSIQEAYPNLFDDLMKEHTEKIQKQKETISTLRFRQFAQSYNNKFKEVQKSSNE